MPEATLLDRAVRLAPTIGVQIQQAIAELQNADPTKAWLASLTMALSEVGGAVDRRDRAAFEAYAVTFTAQAIAFLTVIDPKSR